VSHAADRFEFDLHMVRVSANHQSANGRLRWFKKPADNQAFGQALAEAFSRLPLRIPGSM
jgi:hypothetical protein